MRLAAFNPSLVWCGVRLADRDCMNGSFRLIALYAGLGIR